MNPVRARSGAPATPAERVGAREWPRILITDFYCTYNAGDAAILDGMLAALRQVVPGAAFTVATPWPEAAADRHGILGVPPLVDLVGGRGRGRRLRAALTWRIKLRALERAARGGTTRATDAVMGLSGQARRCYRDADLVLSCGGGFLNDVYYLGLIRRLYGFLHAKRRGRPLMLYAQSIGPFRAGRYARLAAAVLARADVIALRDEASMAVLDALNVRGPRIEVTADAAWALGGTASHTERPHVSWSPAAGDPAAVAGVPPDSARPAADAPGLAVAVRRWQYPGRSDAGARHHAYVTAVAAALDWAQDTLGAAPILASTVAGEEGYLVDDRVTGREVAARMRRPVAVVDSVPTPLSLQALYGGAELVLGTRMHALILGASAGTPPAGIAYEAKTPALLEQLKLPERYVDIEGITAAALQELIGTAWAARAEDRQRLPAAVAALRARSLRNAALAVELLEP